MYLLTVSRDVFFALCARSSHLRRMTALVRWTILNRIAAINAAHLDADLPLPDSGAAFMLARQQAQLRPGGRRLPS
jgi:hypothetical protein